MPELEFGQPIAEGRTGYEQNYVKFYRRLEKNLEKSKAENRTVVDSIDFIKVMVPGDKTLIVDRPVKDEDKDHYPRQYQAFLENKDQEAASGTPIGLLPGLSEERAEEYKHNGCRTVEQLINTPDGNLAKLGPLARQDQAKAKRFLETIAKTADAAKLNSELEKRDAEIEALKLQMKALMETQAHPGKFRPMDTPKAPIGSVAAPEPEADAWYDKYGAEAAEPTPEPVKKNKGGRPKKQPEAQ